jgi:hypothetical protein
VCELRLSGVSLWALAFFLAYCVLLYRIFGFLGDLKKYLLGASASFFFRGSIHESYGFTGFLLGSIPLAVGCPFIRLWERTIKRNVKQ